MKLLRKKRVLPEYDFSDVAVYRAEKARGIMHTKEWDNLMVNKEMRLASWQRQRFLSGKEPLIVDGRGKLLVS